MLESLQIYNFQSHKDSKILFSPNFTVIIGLNNHGKSAVLRALMKVVRDEPSGDFFIRDGENHLRIILKTTEHTIERSLKRDSSSDANSYILDESDVFVKFSKHGIPEEILNSLDISPKQSFGDVEFDINFHDQLDSLFLMVGSGLSSTRGKILNKITGIEKIQKALSYTALEEKRSNQEIKRLLNDYEKLDVQLQEEFSTLDSLIVRYEEVNNLVFSSDQLLSKINQVKIIYSDLVSISKQAKFQKRVISILSTDFSSMLLTLQSSINIVLTIRKVILLEEEYKRCKRKVEVNEDINLDNILLLRDNVKYLATLINTFNSITDNIKKLEAYKNISTDFRLDECYELRDNLQILKKLQFSITNFSSKILDTESSLVSIGEEIENVQVEYEKLIEELQICPLCSKPFKDS